MPPSGSKVRIVIESRTGKQTHEGILISPAGEGLMTIKLVNGYNLSHPLDAIDSIDTIQDATEKVHEEPSNNIEENNLSLPQVTLLHTGGTIASKVDYETGAVIARFEPEEILSLIHI